jgi:undecaprenyl-diphosphatase
MNFIQAVILGLVQGLTEFIPVSSTGHLILARKIMGLDLVGTLSFDAILQLATGLAVLIYFWKDIWNIIKNRDYKLFWALVIGSIPAVILGLFLSDYMDTAFRGTHVVAVSLILGAILFYFAERFAKQNSNLNIKNGLIIGCFQCLALVPGFSRSGATISGGLFFGLTREAAARFSFLLSLPIIFGSGLKKVWDLYQGGTLASFEFSLIIASIFAFISGLLAIHFLIKFLKNHSLNYFGAYRIILAIIILIWL